VDRIRGLPSNLAFGKAHAAVMSDDDIGRDLTGEP
jgi:hypothetical protein